ncbi:MAG TPA: folylpolyglutamate synthase/dihydrofolate synthase family protein [Candidatus Limnocylindria bacterium]|nr:folylpolyglutamate synthase/dihydrofolate synthase family protein [Candidatus Limnocylindria bacterium]
MLAAEEADPRYQAVLARLAARGRFGIRLGLGRTRALLKAMGDPQLGLPGVLIGGTNGKGSTQAMVASVLREAGVHVGQTPKPHLVSYRERIIIDGSMIAVDDFVILITDVLDAADSVAKRHGPPTEFEVITAAAFTWFRQAAVEVGVIEVGLGGRLDATNAWQGGVTAITNVALDHMEYLGDTVEAIAREKAAIIKRGDAAAITGATGPALSVIRRRARRAGVPLELRTTDELDSRLTIGLLGRHQRANASVAVGVVEALGAAGIANVPEKAIERGLAHVVWPGRLEFVRKNGYPTMLFDGAHNPAGIAALAEALIELKPQVDDLPTTVVMGVLANHWQPGMLDPLKAALPGSLLIATTVPAAPNSFAPAKLARAWGGPATVEVDPDAAFRSASQQGKSPQRLLITGSLYLVGYLRSKVA